MVTGGISHLSVRSKKGKLRGFETIRADGECHQLLLSLKLGASERKLAILQFCNALTEARVKGIGVP